MTSTRRLLLFPGVTFAFYWAFVFGTYLALRIVRISRLEAEATRKLASQAHSHLRAFDEEDMEGEDWDANLLRS